MRLIRFGEKGIERPGLLQSDGIVDLAAHFPDIPDIGEAFFGRGWMNRLAALNLPGQRFDGRLGAPVAKPSKIICLGKNYVEHAKEGGFEAPAAPLLFAKAPSAVAGPADPIILPESSGQVDWEVELAVVIGRHSRRVAAAEAWAHVAGFTVMNDVSAREAQFGDGQWFRGKSFDTFAPLGPCLVSLDEIGIPPLLALSTRVDGQMMQEGHTRDMIFDIAFIIEYVSRDITLLPGDIISTGTPSGVGIFRNPPLTLAAGQVVECRIEKIGALVNPIV
jgi:2-keto-4-pentenoate hydratase/2-oxohepta-3-ene-1,7-dioic acid hydratase in catechol pathway